MYNFESTIDYLIRFVGALSDQQIKWLEEELTKCRMNGTYAIVCGHLPVHHGASDYMCLSWNAETVLRTLWSFADTVCAYLAGHDHDGGYCLDEQGIHHITLSAILETPSHSNAFATVNVFEDRVKMRGYGELPSLDIFFKK